MYEFDDMPDQDELFFDHDTAILEALSKVDRGLFDTPEARDEDLEALNERFN